MWMNWNNLFCVHDDLVGPTMRQCWRSWLSRWNATWPFVTHCTRTPCRGWNGPVASSPSYGWWRSSAPYLSPFTPESSTPPSSIRVEFAIWFRNRRFALCSTRIDRPSGPFTKCPPSFSSSFPWRCCACCTCVSASASVVLRSDAAPTTSKAPSIAATAKPITATLAATYSACLVLLLLNTTFIPVSFVFHSFSTLLKIKKKNWRKKWYPKHSSLWNRHDLLSRI